MEQLYQKKLFESIHDEYSAHYYDKESMIYRELFIYKYLWKDLNLNNKKVAEIASGSGLNSKRLLKKFPKADIYGFDISKYACKDYENLTNKKCYLIDLTKENNFKEEYDFVFVVGGIHHCISDLNNTFENIYSMLKPGATFSMMEPNKKYALEFLRKIWYKNDKNY